MASSSQTETTEAEFARLGFRITNLEGDEVVNVLQKILEVSPKPDGQLCRHRDEDFLKWSLLIPSDNPEQLCFGIRDIDGSLKMLAKGNVCTAWIRTSTAEKTTLEAKKMLHLKLWEILDERVKKFEKLAIRELRKRALSVGCRAGIVMMASKDAYKARNVITQCSNVFRHLSDFVVTDDSQSVRFRRMGKEDVEQVSSLLNRKMRQLTLSRSFTNEQVEELFVAVKTTQVYSFVAESNAEIVDFVSFYPKQYIGNSVLSIAHLFYYASKGETDADFKELMMCTMALAKTLGFHRLEADGVMELASEPLCEQLGFKKSDPKSDRAYQVFNMKGFPIVDPSQFGFIQLH